MIFKIILTDLKKRFKSVICGDYNICMSRYVRNKKDTSGFTRGTSVVDALNNGLDSFRFFERTR
jgi:exonuclease III